MADACCAPVMDLAVTEGKQRRVLRIVLGINVVSFAIMALAAFLSGSSSVLSGGLDNLGDALTYAVSLAVIGAPLVVKSRVAFLKGLLILGGGAAVAVQIGLRMLNPEVPVFETMGVAGLLNLGANAACLALLRPHRSSDINMASVYECSRNDIWAGVGVLVATAGVFVFRAGWPDLVVAGVLVALFLRSGTRVLEEAWHGMHTPAGHRRHEAHSSEPTVQLLQIGK